MTAPRECRPPEGNIRVLLSMDGEVVMHITGRSDNVTVNMPTCTALWLSQELVQAAGMCLPPQVGDGV